MRERLLHANIMYFNSYSMELRGAKDHDALGLEKARTSGRLSEPKLYGALRGLKDLIART